MSKTIKPFHKALLAAAISAALPITGFAATDLELLKQEVAQLKNDVKDAKEWRNQNSLMHMAGYANVGYVSNDNPAMEDSFLGGTFAPIFHYQFRDQVMLEAELELSTAEDGSTEVAMEYLSIDWIINDNMILVAGQFLSPIGNFRQNLHPSWINKLPSAAPGFGHDGAAPVSDIGFQLRGGFHLGGMKANYAVYASNGPEIKAEIAPDLVTDPAGGAIDEIEYDGIEAEAFGADADGEKVFGGRFGILPMPSLEIGVSFISGKATVTSYEGDEFTGTDPDLDGIAASTYDVAGMDVSWRSKSFDVRYEYIKSEVGETSIGGFDLAATEWSTWYGQVAYKIPSTKFEAVLRYADFDSPHGSKDLQQTSVGLNYLITNNFIAKLGFESNDNPNAGQKAYDRALVQLAYGF